MAEAMDDVRINLLRQQRNRANDDLVEAQAHAEMLRLAVVGLTEQRDGMGAAFGRLQADYDELKRQHADLATRLEDALRQLESQAKPARKRT